MTRVGSPPAFRTRDAGCLVAAGTGGRFPLAFRIAFAWRRRVLVTEAPPCPALSVFLADGPSSSGPTEGLDIGYE